MTTPRVKDNDAAYSNELLTEICEQLLELDLTPDQIAHIAKDIPGECQAMAALSQASE